ncbi:hypothetical protein AB0I37_25095 [Micromonospora purpureochromogenes]|uniref:hypothetical protein n=1 Tax=Micromonospora purpureochromogenes TaxID=47872 RepID=UPI003410769B
MGILAIHHRKPAPDMPINTSRDYCRAGCWAAPGREHGLACPAVIPQPSPAFRGLLIGLLIVGTPWVTLAAFLIRSYLT